MSAVLVVDVGGSHIKALATGEQESRRADSGPGMSAAQIVEAAKGLAEDWSWESVSVGVPSPIHGGRVVAEPVNLGGGWVGFDYEAAFGKPTKVVNDAAMQALGSYEGGKMGPGGARPDRGLGDDSQTAVEAEVPLTCAARSHRRSPHSMQRGSTRRTITALPQAAHRNQPLVATPAGQNST